MNDAQIKAFLENPSINPLTQRRIIPGKDTYNSLMKMVQEKKAKDALAMQAKYAQAMKEAQDFKAAIDSRKPKPASTPMYSKYKTTQAKPKHVIIMVLGLGCSSAPAKDIEKMRLNLLAYMNEMNYGVDDAIMMCNQSLASTLYDIAQAYCTFRPGLNNAFVKEVAEVVTKHLDSGRRVTLLGHSYGGSVAARVAESFVKQLAGGSNSFATPPSLSVYTFGSIYIPKQARVEGIDITHYMYVNDVALKCNGLSHKVPDPERPVIWLRRSNFETPVQKEFSFFGTNEEWDVHNDYNDVMMKCIRRKV